MTEQQEEYKILSNLDAIQYLRDVVDHFFEDHKNRYKYNNAYNSYRKNVIDKEFTPSKKIYEIITDTSLVNDKHVFVDRSKRSHFYYISKKYLANIDRDKQIRRREQEKNDVTTINYTPIPKQPEKSAYKPESNRFSGFSTDDDDDSELFDLEVPSSQPPEPDKGGTMDDAEDDDTLPPSNSEAISQSILDMSAQFENAADTGLQQFNTFANQNEQMNIREYIDQRISEAMSKMEKRHMVQVHNLEQKLNQNAKMEETSKRIQNIEEECKIRSEKMTNRIFYATTKIHEFENAYETYNTKTEEFFSEAKDKLKTLTNTVPTMLDERIKKVTSRINNTNAKIDAVVSELKEEIGNKGNKLDTDLTSLRTFVTNGFNKIANTRTEHQGFSFNNLQTITRDLKAIHKQHQTRLKRLQDNTEDILDSMEERASTLLNDMKESLTSHWKSYTETVTESGTGPRKKLFKGQAETDTRYHTPRKSYTHYQDTEIKSEEGEVFTQPQYKQYHSPYHHKQDINPEYFRKNIKMKCTDVTQIF